jgi:type IV pilus assembly protein PilW
MASDKSFDIYGYGQSRSLAGFTIVELMVALAISLLVVALATSTFVAARSAYGTNDAATQIQDSGRFATYLLRRTLQQAGYEDYGPRGNPNRVTRAQLPGFVPGTPPCVQAEVCGFNARRVDGNQFVTGTTGVADSSGNDSLMARFQGVSDPSDVTKGDGTIINCMGFAEPSMNGANRIGDRAISAFYVATGASGEPELRCSYRSASGIFKDEPIARGVERFQVLYGVETGATTDSVPDRYMRADEISVADNNVAFANWQKVRSVKIGMVLRGPIGSGPAASPNPQLYPLGTALQSAADVGSVFTPPDDGRLRRVVSFTVNLRNDQK